MASLGGHADPFQLTAEGLAALVLGLVFLSEALFFLLQPRGIIALPRNPAATIQLENPSRDVVEEVTVVGHGNDRTGEILEVPFQPRHGFGVQVVGRFVEQKDIGILQQQAAQRHAALFTTGDDGNGRIPRRAPQGIHRHLKLGVKIPCTFRIHELLHLPLAFDEFIHFLRLHGLGEFGVDLFELLDQINKLLRPFLHDFTDGPHFVDQRFLLQITDGIAGSQHSLSFKGLIHARKDLQQRRFARSVQAEDADLRAVEIGKGNIFQHFTLPMTLGHADHGINNLIGFVAHEISLQKNGPIVGRSASTTESE